MMTFFAEASPDGTFAVLSEEEMHHARDVARLKEGEDVRLIVEEKLYVSSFCAENHFDLLRELPSPEPCLKVTLYQGIPKGDKMEYIVQKCTECGVERVIPVAFSRCVSVWDPKNEKKRIRLTRIAEEAAKQSGRAHVPEIGNVVRPDEIPVSERQPCLVPWENERSGQSRGIRSWWEKQGDKPGELSLVIGPEGGITEEEIALLTSRGAACISLGPRILRTETAGLAALCALMTVSGNME